MGLPVDRREQLEEVPTLGSRDRVSVLVQPVRYQLARWFPIKVAATSYARKLVTA
jgi:hypothetical protein